MLREVQVLNENITVENDNRMLIGVKIYMKSR